MILNHCRVLDLTDEKGALCAKLLAGMGAEVIRFTLKLEDTRGQALFKRIALTCGIIVESYPPGFLHSLNLGYPELSRSHPRLIMASITPFGQTGPYRNFVSSELDRKS